MSDVMDAGVVAAIDYDVDYDRPVYAGDQRPKKWSGCQSVSLETLRTAVETGIMKFLVWDYEGAFDAKGNWTFHPDYIDCEPVLCDLNSARLVIQAHDMLENSKANIIGAIAIRSQFFRLVNFLWSKASFH